jgi:hypothetical protein
VSPSLSLSCPLRHTLNAQDKARSDSMDEAIQLIALGGLMRQAIKLIRGEGTGDLA